MRIDKFKQFIFDDDDMIDTLMTSSERPGPFLVEEINNIEEINELVQYKAFVHYNYNDLTIEEFDNKNQSKWFMPAHYKELDIAKHVLDLCDSQSELQRCGEELLLYQDKDLFDLLRYLVYLVDTMTEHNIIWGVGRGSSVSSFVLYKLKVHKVNSLFYNLQINEFLR